MAKEFSWKDTQEIGEVAINEKKKVEVSFNSLDFENADGTEEVWYVSLATQQFFKKKGQQEADWHITKNATFPMDTWYDIVALINENTEEVEG